MLDTAVVEQLSSGMANTFPPNAAVLEQYDAGRHWRAYKSDLMDGVMAQKVARQRRGLRGVKTGRTRPYSIPLSLRRELLVAADGFSTPVQRQDLVDMATRVDHRCKRAAGAASETDAQIAAALRTRPVT